MRSYQKVIQTTDLKIIIPADLALQIGFSGDVRQLIHNHGFAACQAYNFFANVDWWIGFSGVNAPQNLAWGTLDGSNTETKRNPESDQAIVQSGTGLQIANSLFQVTDYANHALN